MGIGLGIDGLDERPAHTRTPHGRVRVKILQIADIANGPIRWMKDVMHKAYGHTVFAGEKPTLVWMICGNQTRPSAGINVFGLLRFVKQQVCMP